MRGDRPADTSSSTTPITYSIRTPAVRPLSRGRWKSEIWYTLHRALITAALSAPLWAQSSGRVVVVQADRTGKLDSRSAIQKSIDAAARGGGTVSLPKGTYLLNSYRPSTHPWKFYNLLVPSNVTLAGEPGAILLQGPGGRAPLPTRAEHVENNVVAVGTPNYQAITFQDPLRNGGFRPAQPTRASTSTVTLSNAGDAAGFQPGDFIVVYGATSGDVIESEPTSVTAVDRALGVLTLSHPLARSFPRAFVVRVTNLATTRVVLRNLTIQGAVPLAATEVFELSIENCRLIYDSAVGGSNLVTALEVNTIRGFRMQGGSIEPSGARFAGIELPQRNSQDVVFDNVTFQGTSVVFGEYAAHWKLTGNRFWIHPDSTTTAGIATGGLDVEVIGNAIHGENLTAGGGSGALLSDGIGPPDYVNFIGREVFRGNTIECRADGNNCLRLTTRDPVVDQNRIAAGGGATGIKLEGAAAEFVVTGNTIMMGPLPALVFNVVDLHAAVVQGNVLSGTGTHAIVISGSPPGAAVARFSAGNSFSGFGTAILDLSAASRGKAMPPGRCPLTPSCTKSLRSRPACPDGSPC